MRDARPLVRTLRPAARDLAKATPDLTRLVRGAQPPVQHARLQPERHARGRPSAQPRRGLPVLARVAEPRRRRAVLQLGRQRPVPPGHRRGAVRDPQADRRPRRAATTAPRSTRSSSPSPSSTGAVRLVACRSRLRPSAGSSTMVLFALSCFGLLLFLWLAFGGPVPLKPKGYRVPGRVPRGHAAGRAGRRADRRRVGRQGRPQGHRRRRPAPTARSRRSSSIPRSRRWPPDAKAILRQKTLLGETYVELTPGHARTRKRSPRTAGWPTRAVARRRPARRDLPGARPGDPALVPGLAAGPGRGRSTAAARTSTTRSATCRASSPPATTCSPCSTRSPRRCAGWSATPAWCSGR